MRKEKKKVAAVSEKHEDITFPLTVGQVKQSVPNVRSVKPKEKVKTGNSKCFTTSGETSGNIMRICVNLMPLLAAAEEQVGEEEQDEEGSCWKGKMMLESSNKTDPSLETSEEQTAYSSTGISLDANSKQTVCPQLVLPPLTQPESAPESLRVKKCPTPKLPPISLLEQTKNTSKLTIKGCTKDSMPWIDNPLLSKSKSAEFCLPEISLSSLDALLHTVTQRLRRKRGGGGDEEPWRKLQSDHLLMTVSEKSLKESGVGQQIKWYTNKKNSANIEAVTEASVGECRVPRKKRLSPLILRMTNKNLVTPNVM